MTWSIVARHPDGSFGVAVASRFFAVGVLCPHARSGVGALSTQALMNPIYGPAGIDLMAQGLNARQTIDRLLADDAGRESRQVHAIDAQGRSAAHTGSQCIDFCGQLAGEGFSVAGNMLAGPQVLEQTARAYAENAGLDFAQRLIVAMVAGEAAGGDRRGKQAAALRIVATEVYPALDLRVDDHDEPIAELRRLYARSLERYQPFIACLPTRANPAGITDRTVIEREIEHFHARRQAAAA